MGLKDIKFPFDPSSEEDVRIRLAFYFKELGFSLDEMSFEDHFEITLGRSAIKISKNSQIEKAKGYSDLLLFRNGLPLAMVEVKKSDEKLTERHRDQGLSYARLLLNMPPYTIVTNGTDFHVYDTITTDLLKSGSPEEATWWQNNATLEGIQLPDRSAAAKKLVALNFDVFKEFSVQQTNFGLMDLKGDPFKGYRYSPDIFLKRSSVTNTFDEFEQSNRAIFGIYGESGFGKTVTLCHMTEELNQTNSLVLFYRGTRIWKGISDAIKNDFLWDFDAECSISDIIKRLDGLAVAHDTKIYIFIDGLDEYPGNIDNLKAELIDFSQRIAGTRIRLILTCKSHDWSGFIHDRGSTLNSLGHEIFPALPEAQSPGFHLQGFEDSELDSVWLLYSQKYSLSGSLEGETREVSRTPLMLRFIAETYKDSTPPSNLTDVEIFQNYWNRKMEEFPKAQRQTMELIIGTAAQLMIEMDQEEIEEAILFKTLDPTFAKSEEYENIFRFHFLFRVNEGETRTQIAFPFRKLRAYAHTIIGQRWDKLSSPDEIILATTSALSTREGIYALFFFLSVVDSGIENWLSVLIQNDFPLFLKVYSNVFSNSHENLDLADEKLQKQFWERAERFIENYNYIRNNFKTLKTKLAPFTKGDAGIYETGGWFGYRTRTKKYPQAIASLDTDAYRQMQAGDPQLNRDLLPDRSMISNTLPSDLQNKIPEIAAWEEINKRIAAIFENQLLDETQSPLILSERIHYLLSEAPSIGVEGSPRGYYWDLLGYRSINEAQNAECSDLLEKISNLINIWEKNTSDTNITPPLFRWYQFRLPDLYVLKYFLDSFSSFSNNLLAPEPDIEIVFSYTQNSSLDNVSKIAIEQLENVMSSYSSLLETNFPHLVNEFYVYKYRNSQILIEISRDSGIPFRSDYLHLSYIFLPSTSVGKPIIREVELEKSIAENFISGRRSASNIFGIGMYVETNIDGTKVVEKNAVISRTRFPSHQSITNQAYQLIANEAENLFGESFEWMNANSGSFNASKLAELIKTRQIYSKIGY